MTTLPRTTISPSVWPSRGTSRPSSSTTRSSPEVISSTPWRALIDGALVGRQRVVLGPRLADRDERRRLGQPVDLRDRPSRARPRCARSSRPRAARRRSARARRAAAPAQTPRARWRCAISTVGAAHSIVIRSPRDELEDLRAARPCAGRRARAPTAVTVHVNVQPLAWNIGSVQR